MGHGSKARSVAVDEKSEKPINSKSSSAWSLIGSAPRAKEFHVDQRLAAARLLTRAGWIVGNIHVPTHARLTDFLSHDSDFLPLTDVFLEGRPNPVPFFALQKSAIYFLAAMDAEDLQSAKLTGSLYEHQIACLLPIGSIAGKAEIPEGIRVSDFFCKHGGFILMRECHYHIRDPWTHEKEDATETAMLVNTEAAIGVSELQPHV